MFSVVDKVVYGMAGLRFLSSLVELTGAVLMLYAGTAGRALQVNAALALFGPFVLVAVTALGIAGLSNGAHWTRVACVVIGVGFILYGSRGT